METDFPIDQAAYNTIVATIAQRSSVGNAKKALAPNKDRTIKRGGCYPGYWTHDMTTNYAVWYMIPFMTIFFIITLLWEQETEYDNNKKYANNNFVINFPIF